MRAEAGEKWIDLGWLREEKTELADEVYEEYSLGQEESRMIPKLD